MRLRLAAYYPPSINAAWIINSSVSVYCSGHSLHSGAGGRRLAVVSALGRRGQTILAITSASYTTLVQNPTPWPSTWRLSNPCFLSSYLAIVFSSAWHGSCGIHILFYDCRSNKWIDIKQPDRLLLHQVENVWSLSTAYCRTIRQVKNSALVPRLPPSAYGSLVEP